MEMRRTCYRASRQRTLIKAARRISAALCRFQRVLPEAHEGIVTKGIFLGIEIEKPVHPGRYEVEALFHILTAIAQAIARENPLFRSRL